MTKRCIVVHQDGKVTLASGGSIAPFDLDAAIQRGAKIHEARPIGSGTSVLVIIEDPGEAKS